MIKSIAEDCNEKSHDLQFCIDLFKNVKKDSHGKYRNA